MPLFTVNVKTAKPSKNSSPAMDILDVRVERTLFAHARAANESQHPRLSLLDYATYDNHDGMLFLLTRPTDNNISAEKAGEL